jgi:oxygen-independent coproporphyrinogen III oxidase
MTPFGLYIHIPFCSKICHYCDFAKTSNFSTDHVKNYFKVLESQLNSWLSTFHPKQQFSSVFFGGGTPGLFSSEYESIFNIIKDRIQTTCEITLEANPHNIQKENLKVWRSLGFNRISIGVQSFDPKGLLNLTRDHSSLEARNAIELASTEFENVNLDIIYGWTNQSESSWVNDLAIATSLPVAHLSLYNLTFEGTTPMARSVKRGVTKPKTDEFLEWCYLQAIEILGSNSFEHEEISNWSKPGYSSIHNWLYWQGHSYLGIGSGAHGYIDDGSQIGKRYSYVSDLRKYIKDHLDIPSHKTSLVTETDRDISSWLLEYVGCSLRCRDGVDLVKTKSFGWDFSPNPIIKQALTDGLLKQSNSKVFLSSKEWFKETSWSYLLCESFTRKS